MRAIWGHVSSAMTMITDSRLGPMTDTNTATSSRAGSDSRASMMREMSWSAQPP